MRNFGTGKIPSPMILLLRSFFVAAFSLLHPYYVSVAELEYTSKDKELGISIKFFPDDLEAALKQMTGGKMDILKGDKATNDKLLATYIAKHFSVKFDGKAVAPQYLGYENEEGATWCFFSAKGLPQPHTVEVFNNLLYEYRKDQLNFIHMIVNGERKTVQLAMPENTANFTFR